MNKGGLERRLRAPKAFELIKTAEEAAEIVRDGMVIGASGFTPSGYPKAVPLAIAARAAQANENARFQLSLYSGASVGPEIDGAWVDAGILKKRLPYHTDEKIRNSINNGTVEYVDLHLSHSTQYVNYGFLPKIDIAIVEALAITENGDLIPTSGIGNTPAFVKQADKVIVEVNLLKPMELEGMADIYVTENPPNRKPIPILHTSDRIGTPWIECGFDKIAAIVLTEMQDQTRPLAEAGSTEKQISKNIIRFLSDEVKSGRLTKNLLPLQSGIGSVANAVFYGLCESEFEGITCYTEVVQDSMLALLRTGKATAASTTAVSLSPDALTRFEKEIAFFREKIILRPQEISNSPEVARRLGVIAMNTAIEADIYGNINSTHIMGSKIMNGVGGSGDFARNGYITIFATASTAKNGAISSIVPMVSHVDHTEHDTMVIVTEQGYADLRGLSPKERAVKIMENCAHPDYKEKLFAYYGRALQSGPKHTPHILEEALSWHIAFQKNGSML
ncbi:MAG: acetyl-CoA hydrolase/transferase family protein [Clostridiales Family XIII bacterium]|nr:acetyl-CoA hydrolase/transferase family protein [Clostridiales Family XIII bacterium]